LQLWEGDGCTNGYTLNFVECSLLLRLNFVNVKSSLLSVMELPAQLVRGSVLRILACLEILFFQHARMIYFASEFFWNPPVLNQIFVSYYYLAERTNPQTFNYSPSLDRTMPFPPVKIPPTWEITISVTRAPDPVFLYDITRVS
jgi:hypothetical protein